MNHASVHMLIAGGKKLFICPFWWLEVHIYKYKYLLLPQHVSNSRKILELLKMILTNVTHKILRVN